VNPRPAEIDSRASDIGSVYAPAKPIAGLEHDYFFAGIVQNPRGGEPGHSGTNNHDSVAARSAAVGTRRLATAADRRAR
jgi:hypothetical protein